MSKKVKRMTNGIMKRPFPRQDDDDEEEQDELPKSNIYVNGDH